MPGTLDLAEAITERSTAPSTLDANDILRRQGCDAASRSKDLPSHSPDKGTIGAKGPFPALTHGLPPSSAIARQCRAGGFQVRRVSSTRSTKK
jgi:hypothetical protein